MVFALVLMVIFLVWARAASMVHVFFPVESDPELRQILRFLAIVSLITSALSAVFALVPNLAVAIIADMVPRWTMALATPERWLWSRPAYV